MNDNLFTTFISPAADEVFESIATGKHVRIERIVSLGHCSSPGSWLEQSESEWVAVLSGAARLEFEDDVKALEMQAGDHVLIDAHRRHRVAWTSGEVPTIWLAVHFEPSTRF
jgi:cupin 2 domain-containing protein